MRWLRPQGTRGGREAYQLRFLCGAVILALAVAAVAVVAASASGQWMGVLIVLVFTAVVVAQAVAVRLGAPISVVVWTVLLSVGSLLVVNAAMPSRNQLGQLYWFLLLPLAARALVVPRHDDDDASPSRRAEVVLAVAAFVIVVGIMLLQSRLVQATAVRSAGEAISISIDVGLFLLSALGLLYVHDLSVRETAAELKQLRQLLSVCAWCRRIRDGEEWVALEQYIGHRQRVDLTHGMCPSCYAQHVPRD